MLTSGYKLSKDMANIPHILLVCIGLELAVNFIQKKENP